MKHSVDVKKEPSIKKNYIYNLMYQVFSLLTPFITTPYVSRVLGPEGVGVQSYTNSVVQYFMILAALGTVSYGQREIARNRDQKETMSRLFWEIELLCISTTTICLLLWFFVIRNSVLYSACYLILTMNIISVALDISWFFGGLEQYPLIVTRNILVKIGGIVGLFLFIRDSDDLLLYIALLSITTLLGNLTLWGYLRRFLVRVPVKSLKVRRHVREVLVYFVPTIATSVYTILDKTMLGYFTGEDKTQNGYYEYATCFVNMAKILIISFNTVMSARMSYLFAKQEADVLDEIRKKLRDSVEFVCLFGFPLTLGLMGVAGQMIPWFLGEGYEPVVTLLCISAPLIMVVGFSDFMGSQILTPSGQRAKSAKVIVAGAFVNVVLNLILIPRFYAYGAVAASIVAELVITGLYFWLSAAYLDVLQVLRASGSRFLAALVMYVVVRAVGIAGSSPLITIFQVAAGVLVYGIVLLLMRDRYVLKYIRKGLRL